MKNPNGPSIEEKEQMAEELLDRNSDYALGFQAGLKSVQDKIERLESVNDRAVELLARMGEVYQDDHYRSVWATYAIHGGDYTNGPKWVAEFDNLKEALERANI